MTSLIDSHGYGLYTVIPAALSYAVYGAAQCIKEYIFPSKKRQKDDDSAENKRMRIAYEEAPTIEDAAPEPTTKYKRGDKVEIKPHAEECGEGYLGWVRKVDHNNKSYHIDFLNPPGPNVSRIRNEDQIIGLWGGQ